MSGSVALPPHVGSVLGDRYRLDRHIARGGMGDVYAATDELLDRAVAVKLYRAASLGDRSRFDVEVRLLAGLTHPGLVRVFDAGAAGEDAYVVLELIDGPSVRETLHDRGTLPAAETAELGASIAEALAYIHEEGVVHRDVTPANVLCENGRPRLVDFGIARLLDSPRVTATSVAVGTPAYMSPEQVQGLNVGPPTDIYALGLILLEALTGRREFDGSVSEMVAGRLARDPDTQTGVPETWRPLLTAMVARAPEARPSAAAVVVSLRTLDHEDGTQTVAIASGDTAVLPLALLPAPSGVTSTTEARRSIPIWALVAAALALVVGLVVAAADGGPDGLTPPTTVAGFTADTHESEPQATVPTTEVVAVRTAPTTPTPTPKPAKGHGHAKPKG